MSDRKSTLRIVDVTNHALALAIVRVTFYLIIFWGGAAAVSLLSNGEALGIVLGAPLLLAAVLAWSQIGSMDPAAWRLLLGALTASMLLSLGSGAIVLGLVGRVIARGETFDGGHFEAMGLGIMAIKLGVVAGVAIASLMWLKRLQLPELSLSFRQFLARSHLSGDRASMPRWSFWRVRTVRGWISGSLGMLLALSPFFAPDSGEVAAYFRIPNDMRLAKALIQAADILAWMGWGLLVRARRYFQVPADSLLAIDARRPIVFLRSFSDEERRGSLAFLQLALLDFSLEARLAKHFRRFGPFVAVGSPCDKVPIPGAARARLSDENWQHRVLAWLREAQLIVMYLGKTEWVSWELEQVFALGRSRDLLLLLPPAGLRLRWMFRRRAEFESRIERLRVALRGSRWEGALASVRDCRNVRSIVLRDDGTLLVVESLWPHRDSYHLAALIGHELIRDPGLVGAREAEHGGGDARRGALVM